MPQGLLKLATIGLSAVALTAMLTAASALPAGTPCPASYRFGAFKVERQEGAPPTSAYFRRKKRRPKPPFAAGRADYLLLEVPVLLGFALAVLST